MLGNIWISSALIVVAIFSAGALWKSLSDIKEAKQIQEHYEIVKDIKTLIAKQYNKPIEEISRDDIIAHLPKGKNWEKVLLLDRDNSSNISNKALINNQGNITISEDEKLKLHALKAKLKDIIDPNTITLSNIEIGKDAKNIHSKEQKLNESIKIAINFLYQEIVINSGNTTTILNEVLEDKVFFNYADISSSLNITTDDNKKVYIKKRIKEELLNNSNSMKTSLYEKIGNNL